MDDLISRQAAIDALTKEYYYHDADYMTAVSVINALPAQPELIRCKDCKYRNPFIKDAATMWLPCMAIDTDDKWFCGYGE